MNTRTKLLLQIKDKILANPERFDMMVWFWSPHQDIDIDIIDLDLNDCGTTACICGWAAILSGQLEDYYLENDYQQHTAVKLGAEALGLSTAHPLFQMGFWPQEFRFRYLDAQGDSVKQAEAAAAMIDWYIDHQDWGMDISELEL